jgi:hypothetical protein
MSAHPPPVPPDQQSHKGPETTPQARDAEAAADPRQRNLAEQGRQGNVKQNTTNKGFQQDR